MIWYQILINLFSLNIFSATGIFDNTMNRESREQRKISAPPTMETPDRRTSFIKNSSTTPGNTNHMNDNNYHNTLMQNDNESPRCKPSIIMEQVEPTSG